jgi:hypothetical protein
MSIEASLWQWLIVFLGVLAAHIVYYEWLGPDVFN